MISFFMLLLFLLTLIVLHKYSARLGIAGEEASLAGRHAVRGVQKRYDRKVSQPDI